jgi:hypothetical protein
MIFFLEREVQVEENEDPLGVDIKTNSGNQGSTKRMKVDGHEQSTIKTKMGPHNTEQLQQMSGKESGGKYHER